MRMLAVILLAAMFVSLPLLARWFYVDGPVWVRVPFGDGRRGEAFDSGPILGLTCAIAMFMILCGIAAICPDSKKVK